MNVAIVGCGLVGAKRAASLGAERLTLCADTDEGRAAKLAATVPEAKHVTDWRQAVSAPDVDLVIVATPHHLLAEIALGAVTAGKHVLVEKPAAISAAELDPIIDAAKRTGRLVRVGFNHRYHPALRKARRLVEAGELGELMFVRGRYGHGGRLGYEQEWRACKELSGGGELIDQGIHLIDLARMFLGEFVDVQGIARNYYWNADVEDNAFLLLQTATRQVAFLHASWTEWKNMFSFEIMGREGKLDIRGKGGSYGTERITWYRMLKEMGPPETRIWEYPRGDSSWEVEFQELLEDIRTGREPSPSARDAQEALRIVERVYDLSGQSGNG
ncbi:Gfo/Idh/MocA family protein [Planctomycetota bacterium]